MARRIIAALLIIVASLLAPFAVGALWAERTITSAETFVETLAPLADDPVVQQTVATEVSGALVEALDAQTRIENALSNLNGPLAELRPDSVIASSIASGINGAIESGVQSYTQGDRFGELWAAVATQLQTSFMNLVERDTTDAAVKLQDGQIVLDTKIALTTVQAQLDERGVPFAGTIDIPGRDIVLADTPNLQIAADALRIFLPIAAWLWALVLVLFIAGVLLWRPRARGALWMGVGMAVGGGLLYAGLDLGQAQLVDSAPSGFGALLSAITTTLLRFLVNGVLVLISLGVAVALGGWLAGGTASGRKVRDALAGAAHRWGTPFADGSIGRFTSEHPMLVPTLRGVVLVLAVAFLAMADRLSPSMILWTSVATAGALLLVEIVEGAGRGYEAPRAGAVVSQGSTAAEPGH